jgi:hypothetical protein
LTGEITVLLFMLEHNILVTYLTAIFTIYK